MSHLKTSLKSAALGVLLAVSAAPAMANPLQHTVYIYRDGYYPTTTYANVGDTVKFINVSGAWAYVSILGGGNLLSWVSNGNYTTITLGGGSGFTMNKPELWRVSNSNGNRGYVSFSSAPRQ